MRNKTAQLLVVVESFRAIIGTYMSYAFNNQEVANTVINHKYWEKDFRKHIGRGTVTRIVDFKEKKLTYTGANVYRG